VAVRVARMGESRNTYCKLVGKSEIDHLGDLGVDGRVTLQWMCKILGVVRMWNGFIWLWVRSAGEDLWTQWCTVQYVPCSVH